MCSAQNAFVSVYVSENVQNLSNALYLSCQISCNNQIMWLSLTLYVKIDGDFGCRAEYGSNIQYIIYIYMNTTIYTHTLLAHFECFYSLNIENTFYR